MDGWSVVPSLLSRSVRSALTGIRIEFGSRRASRTKSLMACRMKLETQGMSMTSSERKVRTANSMTVSSKKDTSSMSMKGYSSSKRTST